MKQNRRIVSCNAGRTAEQYKIFFVNDNRFSLGSGLILTPELIRRRQIENAPMERWGILELIRKSDIALTIKEKENILIFGDIRGSKWAEIERQKLNHELNDGRL